MQIEVGTYREKVHGNTDNKLQYFDRLNNLYNRNRFKVVFIALNMAGPARRTWTDEAGGNTQLFVFAIVMRDLKKNELPLPLRIIDYI
ncbi:MAG: hypothetical protein KJ666_08725 [Bacteroidetes bacterium]|nr:hypothetical protein [Bacteroidota bacterium]MBU2586480.1 hypothetical protein [Bacteroidota bacterium]